MPFYLRPSAPTAADALICGDPARALMIAQRVMVQPRMSNHNRGLWGYYGETPSGRPLTVQATGIGGPSAVAVLSESIELGVRRVIRVGTCAATGSSWALGAAAVIETAIAADGTSGSLGVAMGRSVHPDRGLTDALRAAIDSAPPAAPMGLLDSRATITSGDLIAAPAAGTEPDGIRDLQTAAVVSLCDREGIAVAAALVIRSLDGRRLHDAPLDASLLRLADAACRALDQTTPQLEG